MITPILTEMEENNEKNVRKVSTNRLCKSADVFCYRSDPDGHCRDLEGDRMISILLSILVIGMAALNIQLIKRIDGDIGKIEDHDDEIKAIFIGLTNAGQQLRDLDLRITKAEQIATNAQNKAIANQKRLERSVVYEKPL